MEFKNPVNGHIESNMLSWLWALLFGGFYFIAAGLWAPFLIWLILAIVFFLSMGPPAVVIMFVINVIYAALAPSMVRAKYLRQGWLMVAEDGVAPAGTNQSGLLTPMDGVAPPTAVAAPASPRIRNCPYCAEEIRAEAIKCKHCGSVVEALPPP